MFESEQRWLLGIFNSFAWRVQKDAQNQCALFPVAFLDLKKKGLLYFYAKHQVYLSIFLRKCVSQVGKQVIHLILYATDGYCFSPRWLGVSLRILKITSTAVHIVEQCCGVISYHPSRPFSGGYSLNTIETMCEVFPQVNILLFSPALMGSKTMGTEAASPSSFTTFT